MKRIALVTRGPTEHVDAILGHTRKLSDALRQAGASVDLVLRAADGSWSVEGQESPVALLRTLQSYDLVVLAYNPFLWGRRGFAPWLPLALWRLRLGRRRPKIALFIHELYLDLGLPWRWLAMGVWQRLQLWAARPAADVVFASIEPWTTLLARSLPRRPTAHTPGGSNLPDARAERQSARDALEISDGTLVVATLSSGEPGRRHDLVAAAVRGLHDAGHDVVLLALGAGGAEPTGIPDAVRVELPGRLSDHELARRIASADMFLAPFPDGISTRRTSAMAPLQQGVPVVATDGHLTDTVWRTAAPAVRLAPVDRPDLFAAAAVELAASASVRRDSGVAARELYVSRFDWSHTASIILAAA